MLKKVLLLLMTISLLMGADADFPASPVDGQIYIRSGTVYEYSLAQLSWYKKAPVALKRTITQTSHGFAIGDVIKVSGANTYAKAQGSTEANAYAIGVVETVQSANQFTFVLDGYISGLSGLTAGSVYYLSAATAGATTSTKPATSGNYVSTVMIAISATEAWVHTGGIPVAVDNTIVTTTGTQTLQNKTIDNTNTIDARAITLDGTTLTKSATGLKVTDNTFVLKAGDTMTGTLTAPGVLITGNTFNLPKVTTAVRTGLSLGSTDNGRQVYDTDMKLVFFWNGTTWVEQ